MSQRSDAISQVRLQFGFWRSKQKSVSFSFKFVKLSSEFKRMIRRVGKALEGKAREHYREPGQYAPKERHGKGHLVPKRERIS